MICVLYIHIFTVYKSGCFSTKKNARKFFAVNSVHIKRVHILT